MAECVDCRGHRYFIVCDGSILTCIGQTEGVVRRTNIYVLRVRKTIVPGGTSGCRTNSGSGVPWILPGTFSFC